MPALQATIGVLTERPYWLQSDLESRLRESELVEHRFSISGLLNLASDLVAKAKYRIYTPDLEAATRNSIGRFRDYLVIADSEVTSIKLLHKKLKGLPGRYGIAKLSYLATEEDRLKYANHGLPEELIMLSEKSWSMHDQDDLWFVFEDRDNVLINYSEKVFSIIDECSPEELARSYRNALGGRGDQRYIYDYPPEEVIRKYLMNSRMLNYDGRVLRYIGENKTPPTPIDKELVDLLRDNPDGLRFPQIRDHLVSASYSSSNINKRSDCSYTERTEPYIVILLGKFGCDFLYETRHVLVEQGTVQRGTPLQHQAAEVGYLEQVLGNKVDNKWLAGHKFDSWK